MKDLQRQLDQKAAQLSALREIGRAINAAWELQATLDLITRKTAEVMGMDSCSIYLLDEAEAYLTLEATTGLAQASVGQAQLRLGEGLTGWAAQAGEPVAVADAAHDPRFKHLPETKESIFQSLLAVPLSNQGRVIGAMNVQTERYHEYGADEIELLSLIGDLAAGALEKAMLYDQMQRQITELSTLAEVSEAITSPLYLDEMLDLVVDMAAQVMRARATSLMLLNEQDELILHATHGLGPAYRDKPPLRLGQGITGRVAEGGQPRVVKDVRREPRYHYTEIAAQEGLQALLCVPLQVRERVIGVLNGYTDQPHTFTPQEIELFQTLANQTALAIENARLVVNTAVVREMHHRVKNNLQTIAMLLRLQLGEPELDAEEALRESIDRILSIAAVHEAFSERGFRMVDVKQVFERVARTVMQNRLHFQRVLQVSVEGDEVVLPSREATALTLAVNELVQNALKHAFAGRDAGKITIGLQRRASGFRVVVQDDGVGLSAERAMSRDQSADRSRQSLGLQIIETLVTQDLGGELVIKQGERGTRAIILVEEAE
jgi:signal transduction protein with GAF and PtsI domain/anti-sigma regulatory factor (Ser/Thr protein kinase)